MKTIAIACALLFVLLLQPLHAQNGWQKLNSGSTSGFKGVSFITTKRGYVAGSGPHLQRTTDGGSTWSAIEVTGATEDLWDVYASSGPAGDTITVVGDNGAVYRSNNNGTTWTRQDLHYSLGFTFAIFGVDSRNMCATGYEGSGENTNGVIVTTHDGGETWVKSVIPGAGTFDKSVFLTPQLGYAAGGKHGGFREGGLIYKTTDGGVNWTLAASAPVSMNSIHCFDENNWVAVGYDGVIIKTTNGGSTWKRSQVPTANATDPFTHVAFINSDTGFVTSAYGAMLKTDDGGATWTRDNSFLGGSILMWTLEVVESETETVVFAVGEAGSIFRYRLKKAQQQPTATLSDTELDFEEVFSGTKEMELTIEPANALGLRIDSVYIEEPAAGFTLLEPSGPYPIAIVGGSYLSVRVRFTPNPDGPETVEGTLVMTTNDPAHPTIEISLVADQKEGDGGGGGQPAGTVSTSTLSFGKVEKNGTKEMTVTVSAANAAGLRVQALSVENEIIPGTFTVVSPTGPFPMNVTMNAPLTITLRFKPQEVAATTADLYIETNSGSGEDLHVVLSGEGVTPVASVDAITGSSRLALAAYPNPISGSGALHLNVPASGHLTLELYDMLGRRSMLLFNGVSEAGLRSFTIDATTLPPGAYRCVARMNGSIAGEQITITR